MLRRWWPLALLAVLTAQSPSRPSVRTPLPDDAANALPAAGTPTFVLPNSPVAADDPLPPAPDTTVAADGALPRVPHAVKRVREKINAFRWSAKPENTHLVVDRVVYHAGDSLYFAAFVHEHTRFAQAYSERLYVALVGPRNDTVFSRPLIPKRSCAYGAVLLPSKIAPGIYRLVAFTEWMRRNNRPYSTRPVVVMPTRRPALKLFVKWEKEKFFIGETVEARIYIKVYDETAEEERQWARKPLTVQWKEGRQILFREELTTDDFGVARAKFAPSETPIGLSLVVGAEYDGVSDEVRYPVPYCDSRAVQLRFFPEGGKMFPGLKNRVAFKATYADGSPAQVAGDIVLPDGRALTRFETVHAGMGEFFVETKEPVALTALLKVPQPAAVVKSAYPLPAFAKTGVYIHYDDKKTFRLAATKAEKVVFCVVIRDSVYDCRQLYLQSTPREVKWKSDGAPAGLARAQVFSSKGRLLVERRFFHRPAGEVKIEIQTDKPQYFPGDRVTAGIRVVDEKGRPTTVRGVLTAAAQKAAHVPAFPLPLERTGGAFAGDLTQNPSLRARYLLEIESPVPIPGLDAIVQKDKAVDLLMLVHAFRTVPWMEKDEPQSVGYKPEKNVLSGVVMDVATRSPIANIVRVYDADGTFYVPTGPDGRFTVADINLEERGGWIELRFRYAGDDKDCHRKIYYDYHDDDTVWVDDMTAYRRASRPDLAMADFFAQDLPTPTDKDRFPYPPTPRSVSDVPQDPYLGSVFGRGVWDAEGTYLAPAATRESAPPSVLRKKAFALTDSADFDAFEHVETWEDQDPEAIVFKTFADSAKIVWKSMPARAAPKNGRFTAYWNAEAVIEEAQTYAWTQPAQTGLYEIRFRGMDSQGRPVEGRATYRCAEPFHAEAVLPAACATDDILKIPITVLNRTTENLTCSVRVRLPPKLIANTPPVFVLDVPAQKKVVRYVDVLTHQSVGRDSIRIEVESDRYRRVISGSVRLRHKTPRTTVLFTGQGQETKASVETTAPAKFFLKAYPTLAAELWDASEALAEIDMPTMESAAARIGVECLLLDYLRRNEHVYNPMTEPLRRRAVEVIERAARLMIEEIGASGDVESPGNPMRNGAWALWALRTLDNAGFEIQGLPTTNAMAERLAERCRTTRLRAFELWLLTEAGYRNGLQTFFDAAERNGAYVLAALKLGRNAEAQTALIALARRQAADGGIDRSIEETALFLLALLRFGVDDAESADRANRAMDFILRHRRADGAFGGPVATFLALLARNEYLLHGLQEKDYGVMTIYLNADKALSVEFHTAQYEPVYATNLEKYAKPGKNVLKVVFQETPTYIPFVVGTETNGEITVDGKKTTGYAATLEAEWTRTGVAAGKTTGMTVSFAAPSPALLRTALPAGIVPDDAKFDALVADGRIQDRRFNDGELWVWTAKATDKITLPLKALLPGEYGETAVILSPVDDPGFAVGALLPAFDVYK